MSHLTMCNCCTLVGMRRRAESRGVTVVLGRDEHGWVTARYSDRPRATAFFMELTPSCAC